MSSNARVMGVVAGFSLPPSIVLAVLAGILGGPIAAVAVLIVVAAALSVWARGAGDRRVAQRLSGRPADRSHDARLCNLVEGLSITAGVRQPRLLVVESAGLNALAAGSSPAKAVVAVTSGLLAELDRVELEAVLALELAQLRRGALAAPTVAAGAFGLGRRYAVPADRDAQADQAAVELTRYPPGLASALEKMEAKGTEVPDQPPFMASLWMAEPRHGAPRDVSRLPLRERIEALREL